MKPKIEETPSQQSSSPNNDGSGVSVPGQVIQPIKSSYATSGTKTKNQISPSYSIESGQQPVHPSHRKSRKKVLAVILACLCLTGLIGLGLYSIRNKPKVVTPSTANTPIKPVVIRITAKTKDDYANVCGGNVINDAPAVTTLPRVIALFDESDKGTGIYSSVDKYITNYDWISNAESYKTISLVGCMTHKNETRSGKTCEVVAQDGTRQDLDLYSIDYQLRIFTAIDAKPLGTYLVSSPVPAVCPNVAYFSQGDKRIYTSPDTAKLNQSIGPFIKP